MELVTALFQGPLLLYTVPILIAVFFWLLALVGMLDFEALDFDLDVDADVDVDVDVDLHADLGGGGGFLHLLGLGMIPFSLMLTLILFIFGWIGIALYTLLGGILDGAGWSPTQMNLLFAPLSLVGSLAASAKIARLLHPLFEDQGQAHGAFDLVGKMAVLNSSSVSSTFGSAIVKLDGDRLEIASRSEDDDNGLHYGDRVLVVDYDPDKNIYLVAPYDEDT